MESLCPITSYEVLDSTCTSALSSTIVSSPSNVISSLSAGNLFIQFLDNVTIKDYQFCIRVNS